MDSPDYDRHRDNTLKACDAQTGQSFTSVTNTLFRKEEQFGIFSASRTQSEL